MIKTKEVRVDLVSYVDNISFLRNMVSPLFIRVYLHKLVVSGDFIKLDFGQYNFGVVIS